MTEEDKQQLEELAKVYWKDVEALYRDILEKHSNEWDAKVAELLRTFAPQNVLGDNQDV